MAPRRGHAEQAMQLLPRAEVTLASLGLHGRAPPYRGHLLSLSKPEVWPSTQLGEPRL